MRTVFEPLLNRIDSRFPDADFGGFGHAFVCDLENGMSWQVSHNSRSSCRQGTSAPYLHFHDLMSASAASPPLYRHSNPITEAYGFSLATFALVLWVIWSAWALSPEWLLWAAGIEWFPNR